MRFQNFRIVRLDGGRCDHHIRAGDVFRRMPDGNGCAQLLQALRRVGGLDVRSADAVSEIQQHFGDAAHSDAADADKMDALDFTLHESGFLVFAHFPFILLNVGFPPPA